MERGRIPEVEETAIEAAKIARKAISKAFDIDDSGPYRYDVMKASGFLVAEVFKKLTDPSEPKK